MIYVKIFILIILAVVAIVKPKGNTSKSRINGIFLMFFAVLLIFRAVDQRPTSINNKAVKILDSLEITNFDENKFLKAENEFLEAIPLFYSKNDFYSYSIACANIAELYSMKWLSSYDDTYFNLAEEYYNKSAEKDTKNPEQYYYISELYYHKSELSEDFMSYFETSFKYAKLSYDRDPNYSKANFAMGSCYYDMWLYSHDTSYFNLAEKYLQTALDLDSDDSSTAASLMSLYYDMYELEPDNQEYIDKYNNLYDIYNSKI